MMLKNFWVSAAAAGVVGLVGGYVVGMTLGGRRVGGATPHGPYNDGNPVWSDYGKKGLYIEGLAAGRHRTGSGATPHGPYNNGNPVWSDYGKKGLYMEGLAAGRQF